MIKSSPTFVYYEGLALTGESIYRHTAACETIYGGYRIISRRGPVGTDINIAIRKNGSQIGTATIGAGLDDSGEQALPSLYFSTDDQLELAILSTGVPLNEGAALTLVFDTQLGDRVESDDALKRFQTPLVAHLEGLVIPLQQIMEKQFKQDALLTRIRVFARQPAQGQDILLSIQKDNVELQQITLPAGSGDSGHIALSQAFVSGETMQIVTVQGGSLYTEGESLFVVVDYKNTAQTTFNAFQTPFIIQFESLLQDSLLLRYTAPRTFTLKIGQALLRSEANEETIITLARDGAIQTTLRIPAGSTVGPVQEMNVLVQYGETIELVLAHPELTGSSLTITLDYTIENVGQDFSQYNYYADPDSDIILMARQIGIGGGKADALRIGDLAKYKRDADNIINSHMRSLYRVPATKVRRAGATNPWPHPLQWCAQRLVLRNLVGDVFSEVEPNASANASRNGDLAMNELGALMRREFILEGQKMRPRNSGSNPYTEPMAPFGGEAPAATPRTV